MLKSQLARRPSIIISTEDYQILISLAAHCARRTPEAAALLMEETDRAEVVPRISLPAGVVAIGSDVVFTDGPNGITRRVQLVMPAEADIEQGRVSILSLVGAGLIGLSAGQSIDWPTQDGRLRCLSVLSVHGGAVGTISQA